MKSANERSGRLLSSTFLQRSTGEKVGCVATGLTRAMGVRSTIPLVNVMISMSYELPMLAAVQTKASFAAGQRGIEALCPQVIHRFCGSIPPLAQRHRAACLRGNPGQTIQAHRGKAGAGQDASEMPGDRKRPQRVVGEALGKQVEASRSRRGPCHLAHE